MVDERKYVLNLKPSDFDSRDWMVDSILPLLAKDGYIDYRKVMLPIRDQGNQGSCAAMTAAAMKEWQENKDVGYRDYFSPQFVYDQREEPAGMQPRNVMKILNKVGIVPESYYPYFGKDLEITDELKEKAVDFKIKSYARVESMEALNKALNKNGPCFIGVPVWNRGPRMWKKRPEDEVLMGGHAMAIVGRNKDGYIIRNSWSDEWGNNGYCIFPYEDWGCHWEVWTTVDEDTKDPDFNTRLEWWIYKILNWSKENCTGIFVPMGIIITMVAIALLFFMGG